MVIILINNIFLLFLKQFRISNYFYFKSWEDDRIRWDPKDFNNLTMITLPVDKLWVYFKINGS
jgi:hypothetical protein